MHNKFHNLIDDLRILNQQFRKERPDPKEFLDSIRYAIEYCTITIDIGRQTGKSTYIKNNYICFSLSITFKFLLGMLSIV